MYNPIKIEVVYPDGEVRTLNAFKMENAAVQCGDPKWPRQRLLDMATIMMQRWIENYYNDQNVKLRLTR